MLPITDIFRWLIDTAAACTLLLTLACGIILLIRQPARRLRIAELALLACLLVALLQAIPATRLSLNLVQVNQPARLPWFDDHAPITPTLAAKPAAPSITPTAPALTLPLKVTQPLLTHWREILLTLWTLGVLITTTRLLLACRTLRQLAARGHLTNPHLAHLWSNLLHQQNPTNPRLAQTQLRLSPTIARPMTFGLRRPVILLPLSLAEAPTPDLTVILRHELAHVERSDAAAWILAAAANILLFFLPPLWLIKREIRLSQEFLADRAAVPDAGGPVAYAEIMLRLATLTQSASQPRHALAMAAWSARSDLLLRIRHLFNVKTALETRCARRCTLIAALCLLLLTAALGAVTLADTSLKSQLRNSELRGVAYLLAHQESTGGWLTQVGPAPTALVVRSLLQAGVPLSHPAIQHARQYVATCRHTDGGYYTDGEPTYQTAVVMSMYAAIDDQDARQRLDDGREFLTHNLDHPIKPASPWYQNNAPTPAAQLPTPFADPRERAADAVLDTYGSLTYTRWKSLIYAGLPQSDPRVKLAARWLATHWTLDKHPGTGSAEGLFYYYLAAARTLKATGNDQIAGHNWRTELAHQLLNKQSRDGSWINTANARWLEDRPEMVTAYALLALQETR